MAFGWSYGSSVTIYRGKRISLDFDRDTGFSERAVRIVLFSTNKNSTIKGSSAVDSFKLFPLPSALEMLTWEIDLAAALNRIRCGQHLVRNGQKADGILGDFFADEMIFSEACAKITSTGWHVWGIEALFPKNSAASHWFAAKGSAPRCRAGRAGRAEEGTVLSRRLHISLERCRCWRRSSEPGRAAPRRPVRCLPWHGAMGASARAGAPR